MPQAAIHHGRARQTLRTGPYEDYKRVIWVPGPQRHYLGKIRFIDRPGVQDEGVAMLLNVVLITGKPIPKSKVRDGT